MSAAVELLNGRLSTCICKLCFTLPYKDASIGEVWFNVEVGGKAFTCIAPGFETERCSHSVRVLINSELARLVPSELIEESVVYSNCGSGHKLVLLPPQKR